MADRYFTEHPIEGGSVVLDGPEAHHLLHVMRARLGMEVVLFDGTGAEFVARVEKTARSSVELAVIDRKEVDRELPFVLTLGVSLPKGDRQKWLVEKSVELGLTRLVPLVTERSVAQPVDQALERLRRGIIEASKQCGRNKLMEIGEPQSWTEFVRDIEANACRWIAHPGGDTCSRLCPASADLLQGVLAVGPEGGFTEDEVALALSAGWQRIDLGPRILRVETAAVLMVGLAAQAMPQR